MATGFLAAYEWRDARDDGDWLIYYRPGKRAEDEIQRARAERRLVSDTQEALPGMEDLEQEQVIEMAAEGLSGAQEALLGQLVALNVSEITARDLVRYNALDGIRKWLEAIEYTEAQDKAAFLVRAIQENWQVSDAYLKSREMGERQQKLRVAELARQKGEQREEKRLEREARKLDRVYESLSPEQRAEVDRETQARIPPALRQHVKQRTDDGEASPASAAILRSSLHDVLRSWLSDGKLKA